MRGVWTVFSLLEGFSFRCNTQRDYINQYHAMLLVQFALRKKAVHIHEKRQAPILIQQQFVNIVGEIVERE